MVKVKVGDDIIECENYQWLAHNVIKLYKATHEGTLWRYIEIRSPKIIVFEQKHDN